MPVAIRPWRSEDLPSVRQITWISWIAAYSGFIPETDLKSHFDAHYTEALLGELFQDPSVHGLVALVGDRVAGYARLSFEPNGNRLSVSSLYLLPEFQKQAVGTKLLDAAEKFARSKGLDALWIGVMVQNRPALRFYRKMGFVFVREEPFTMGRTTVDHLIGCKRFSREGLLRQKAWACFDEETMGPNPDSAGDRPGSRAGQGLAGLCHDLLTEQQEHWPDLQAGARSWEDIGEREVLCSGFSVRLQHNPGRIRSSTAGPGPESGKERECFLCLDRLPEVQRGILYRGEYLVLCNPMPVFSSHFTIPHVDHRRQAIAEHLDAFLGLVLDLGPGWAVLYNGPRCGASAPDHFHFQAGPSGEMSIWDEIRQAERLLPVGKTEGVDLHRLQNLGREVLLLSGDEAGALKHVFNTLMKALQEVFATEEEPLVNIAGSSGERSRWQLMVFPRRKHRPDLFYRKDHSRRVISPGVIDMGGLLITPVKKDFEELDAPAVEEIYREVSLEEEAVDRALNAMERML